MPRTLTHAAIEDFRDRLRKIAAELFMEVGQDGFNMRELAKRMGVSAMTPYRYFSDKNEILGSIRSQAFARLADRLEDARTLRASSSDKIAAVAKAYVRFAQEEEVNYRLIFDFSRPKRNSPLDVGAQKDRVLSALTALMRDLVDTRDIEGDPEIIAQVLWSAMHGAVALNLVDAARTVALDDVIDETIHLALAGYNRSGGSASTQLMTDDYGSCSPLNPSMARSDKSDFAVLTPAE